MKLERLVVFWNNYDFMQDGVGPKSYGVKASFSTPVGSVDLLFNAATVQAILDLITPIAVEHFQTLGKTNERDIKNAMYDNLLGPPKQEDHASEVPF